MRFRKRLFSEELPPLPISAYVFLGISAALLLGAAVCVGFLLVAD